MAEDLAVEAWIVLDPLLVMSDKGERSAGIATRSARGTRGRGNSQGSSFSTGGVCIRGGRTCALARWPTRAARERAERSGTEWNGTEERGGGYVGTLIVGG